MSELRYAYDLYPRDDPLGGARILRFSDLEEAEWNAEANGTGSGVIILPGDSTDADSIDPRGLQYIRVVEIDPDDPDGATLSGFAERVVFGFFLDTGSFDALTEQNTKRLTFGGAGTLSYLARAVMAPHTYISPIFTGQDPFDDIWRLYAQSTAYANGNYLGAMLWRVIYEAQHFTPGSHRHVDGITVTDTHADDRTESAIPDLVMGFDQFDDSAAAAWTASSGEFKAQIGENVLRIVQRFMEAGLYVSMDPDTFVLDAWQAAGHGRTRTGGAWGASVIRFQSPTDGTLDTGNILSDAKRALTAHIQRSLLWAGGSDVYAKSTTGGSDIPWEGFYSNDAADATDLTAIATVQLGARSDAGDTLRVRTVPIDDPASGFYRPLHSTGILLDDLATVHNGSGQWDFDEQTFPVAGVGGKLREGGDWDTFVDLGASFRPIAERAFQVSDIPYAQLQLCAPAQPGGEASCSLDPSDMTAISTPNGGFETAATTNWQFNHISGGLVGPGTGAWEGSYYYQLNGAGWCRIDPWTGYSFVAGTIYVCRYLVGNISNGTAHFGVAGGDENTASVSTSGNAWEEHCIEWTPASTVAGANVHFGIAIAAGLQNFGVDNVRAYTGGTGSNPLHGTSKYAARCDSTEHEILARDPTVNDDEASGYPRRTIWHNSSSTATFISTDGTEGAAVWVEIGSGAPSDATYLVTTAHADLSAEVVVGATPGGELGGTWASPTVDATHSGSSHAGVVTTHEAAADPHTGYVKESEFTATGDYLRGTGAATFSVQKNNMAATVAPTANEDSSDGYSIGSQWFDTTADKGYVALDVAVGAAVWKETTASPTGGTIEVEDEGTPLATSADTLDFVGAGVTATGAGATKTITIPGGGGTVDWNQDVNESGASLTNWTGISGTWSTDGTMFSCVQTGGTTKLQYEIAIPHGAGLIFEAEIQIDTSGGGGGIAGLIIGSSSTMAAGGLSVGIADAGDVIQVERFEQAVTASLTKTINQDTFYKLRCVIVNLWCTIYVDGTLLGTTRIDNTGLGDQTYLGLRCYNAKGDFKNIKAWTLSTGLPA